MFDKKTCRTRINSINDIASENCFYDVNPNDVFSEAARIKFREIGLSWDNDAMSQGIEKAFAEGIETRFSELLNVIRDKAKKATPWIINNCYFISAEQKIELSMYLAIQFIRGVQVRNTIRDSADCLVQVLKEMGAKDEMVAEYSISKADSKIIHTQMLLDYNNMCDFAIHFLRLTWLLGINSTKRKLYTSDSPIGTFAHIKDPIRSMSGLGCKGVEVYFPISPNCILIMVDGSYHVGWQPLERHYVSIDNEEFIEFYSWNCAMRSERCIYSQDGNFSTIDRMLYENTNAFEQPHVQLEWGGKTFTPSEN